MPALIYIHGFLSSPLSHKAQRVKQWLTDNRPEIHYHCPHLTPYPQEVCPLLEALVESLLPQPVYLIGSSLGGYWATYLVEKYNVSAVIINPLAEPGRLIPAYKDMPLKNYHTDHVYQLDESHVQALMAIDTPQIKRLDNYWLMVQTNDQTLDYRPAVKKYSGCKQLVEQGGDHSFVGFDNWLGEIMNFFDNFTHSRL